MQPRMLHHVSLGASDIDRAARFYDAVLAPLGYVRVWADLRPGGQGQAVGYGCRGFDDELAIKQTSGVLPEAPGLRPIYGANYFAAFVIDPEGHHLEAVCRGED